MSNALRTQIEMFASQFATHVMKAIRSASLEDILYESGGAPGESASPRRRPGRPRKMEGRSPATAAAHGVTREAGPRAHAAPAKRTKSGRLLRRSPAEILRALARVVALVKASKAGLRAEQIRAQLDMEAKEMPRVLKEGLAKKALKSKGQKRATTYTAG